MSSDKAMLMSTVYGIITKGPFAGTDIVEISVYTGAFRTKYFYRGFNLYRRDFALVGDYVSFKRLITILSKPWSEAKTKSWLLNK